MSKNFTGSSNSSLFQFHYRTVNWRTNERTHSYKAKKLPPGHAKKLNGDKSAKRYAPGHNK
jgi:hypothetical protein